MRLLSSTDEEGNSDLADRTIVDAFRLVRQYLRQHDPDALWHKHNTEYGFWRNLLGCRIAWVVLSILALIFATIHGFRTGAGMLNPASAIAGISLACAAYVGWFVTPEATNRLTSMRNQPGWHSCASVKTNRLKACLQGIRDDDAQLAASHIRRRYNGNPPIVVPPFAVDGFIQTSPNVVISSGGRVLPFPSLGRAEIVL